MGKEKRTKIPKIEAFEYQVRIDSVKSRDKVVKRIERAVRSSLENRDFLFFLKENMDFSKCAFFQNIDSKISKARIEIHHEPFTLYDICDIVLQKWMDEGYPINELLIADEVAELHYANKVGLIPLSLTIHQMIHPKKYTTEQKIFIPTYMVSGNYKAFVKEYGEYMDDAIYERFKKKIDRSKEFTEESFQALIKEFEYLEIEGVEDLEKMEISEDKKIEIIEAPEIEFVFAA